MKRCSKGIQRFYGVLINLGYSNYWDYLQSEQWRAIRQRVLELHKGKCLFCPLNATQIHHTSYRRSVLVGTDLSKLIPLCRSCHQGIEFTDKGAKRTIIQARRIFYRQWRSLPAWIKRQFKARLRGRKWLLTGLSAPTARERESIRTFGGNFLSYVPYVMARAIWMIVVIPANWIPPKLKKIC